jgi:geranylgeranyl pyrophosphate synthase
MLQIDEFIADSSARINSTLDQLLPTESTEPTRLHAAVRWSVFGGGKRLRPLLVLASGLGFGAEENTLLRTAVAIEMIHTYSLIHDDLPAMDDDDIRRGRETCHVRFGEATAILAGDLLATLAFKTIADDVLLSPEQRVRLITEIAAAAASPGGMIAGQQFDLDAEGLLPDPQMLENIHSNKTAALIRISVRAGAIIAHADETSVDAVTEYGEKLGLLFQITDDLLDVTQSTEILGKTAAKDIVSEKATYPRLYGVEGTRGLAATLHKETVSALDRVDGSGTLLEAIANQVLDRKY